jgi:hypothetical protein
MFEQRHEAGREGAFDFTDCAELEVTIAGQAFAHLLFQFVLSFSKWRWVIMRSCSSFAGGCSCQRSSTCLHS